MKELFLLKLGEIVLKGQNRRVFEDKLKTVTRRRMAKFGTFKVSIVQSTLYVEPQTDDCDLDGAWEACGTIFGVAQMCRCRACEKDLDAIFAAVCDYLGDELSMARSFKVESKRSDKRFPLNSIQISQEIGGRLAEEFPNVAVDVHTPDYTVNIEVRETAAYVKELWPEVFVCPSVDITKEWREYERTTTAALNELTADWMKRFAIAKIACCMPEATPSAKIRCAFSPLKTKFLSSSR